MSGYVPYDQRFGPDPECVPSFTLEQHIASLRDTNPQRWAELQAEWSAPECWPGCDDPECPYTHDRWSRHVAAIDTARERRLASGEE